MCRTSLVARYGESSQYCWKNIRPYVQDFDILVDFMTIATI